MRFWRNQSISSVLIVAVIILGCCLCASVSDAHDHHHGGHDRDSVVEEFAFKLPEELAEEEFLRTHGFSSHHHDHLDDSVASELSSAGGGHLESGSHGHHMEHDHHHEHAHNHSHSLRDLSVGLSILGGIVLFLIVEKIVQYVEDHSDGNNVSVHGHHHHHHTSNKKSKDDTDDAACLNTQSLKKEDRKVENVLSETGNGKKTNLQASLLRKGSSASNGQDEKTDSHLTDDSVARKSLLEEQSVQSPSNLVFGCLNLFSDDVVGDFGILVRSGFSVSKALFFNFLSALVALAGTALVLLWGQNPGESSIIEGFTAGGFIYIAVAGVLAEMNSDGSTKLKSTAIQLVIVWNGF